MEDTAPDLVAPASALHRPGGWHVLQPALSRLGQPAAGPQTVADWLAAPTVGSEHEAERALTAIGRQRWHLARADAVFMLHAGDHAWKLQPVPAHQPAQWRDSRA